MLTSLSVSVCSCDQGPGFDAPHEEFEHHDHGVQWDFSPDQSGGYVFNGRNAWKSDTYAKPRRRLDLKIEPSIDPSSLLWLCQ